VPTYQYACKACDHRFEAVQSFSDAALTECPECSGLLRKVFSSVGIVFKGSGFYRTDSRAGASSVAGGDSGAGKDGASKDGGSKESASSSTSSSSNGSSASPSTSASPSSSGSGSAPAKAAS
jgi:putative FmdB family regulatory protein